MGQINQAFISAPKTTPPSYHKLANALLQRRFTRTIVLCGLLAHLIGYAIRLCFEKSFSWNILKWGLRTFWLLFPLQLASWRCILIFTAAIPILILRKANLRVQHMSSKSFAGYVISSIFAQSSLYTLGVYLFSAWLVLQVLILSSRKEDSLSPVIRNRSYDVPRLNERFLFLSFVNILLAVLYTAAHILQDRDHLKFPTTTLPIYVRIKARIPVCIRDAAFASILTHGVALLLYFIIRRSFWKWMNIIVKLFISSRPGQISISFGLIAMSIAIVFLISLMWELNHALFDVYISHSPFNRSRNISSLSVDANGTLLDGLRMKNKPLTQCLAFQELSYVAFAESLQRRKIYTENDGSDIVWHAILKECLLTITNGFKSIHTDEKTQNVRVPTINLVSPATVQVKQDNVFIRPSSTSLVQRVSSASPVQSVESASLPKPIPTAVEKMVQQSEALTTIRRQFLVVMSRCANVSIAKPFRQTAFWLDRAHFRNARLLCDAIIGLAQLCVEAAQDNQDEYGIVAQDVPIILETYCDKILSLRGFVSDLQTHKAQVGAKRSTTDLGMNEAPVLLHNLEVATQRIFEVFGRHISKQLAPTVLHVCRQF